VVKTLLHIQEVPSSIFSRASISLIFLWFLVSHLSLALKEMTAYILFGLVAVGIGRYSDWLQAGRPRGRSSESRKGRDFFPLHVVQTGSGAHPPSYPMGTGGFFPECKAAGGVKLTIHLALAPISRKRGYIRPLLHTPSSRSA
jgi:hypothetical protein